MNETQTREEWLASLKPGDQVATYYRYTGYTLHEVAKRTPSGRIVLTTGKQYSKDGGEMGGDKWSSDRLEEVTPQVLANIKHRQLVSAVSSEVAKLNVNVVAKMDDARLEELLAVLKKQGE